MSEDGGENFDWSFLEPVSNLHKTCKGNWTLHYDTYNLRTKIYVKKTELNWREHEHDALPLGQQ